MDRLPQWMKNKWVLFALSMGATLVFCLLIFLLFLRGPFASGFAKQGAAAIEAGEPDRACNRYALALKLKKNREEIYLGYTDALAAVKDYDTAIEILEQGIDRISGAEALYLRKVQIYVEAGRIGAAADFLDNIDNSYINKKIQSRRPADLTYSPAQGKYNASQKVTLMKQEGQTIYYTLDGEDPTLTSSVYKEPIHLRGNTTLIAIAVDDKGFVSPRLTLTYEIDNANEPIEFEDQKVEQMVRMALGKNSGPLYAAQLTEVTSISGDLADGEIRTLNDLEFLPSLNSLYLNNELLIEDYSVLSRLPGLTSLWLSGCALTETNLAQINACHQLTELDLSNNQINSLDAIADLSYLEYLNVSGNELSAISSVEFPALISLDLSHNWLTDLTGLETYQTLVSLNISDNTITDLTPVTKLKNLNELWLSNNKPSNIKKLSALKSLVMLDISGCQIASLSIVNDFPALSCLIANYNEIASLSTFTKQVQELKINHNPLVDLSPLASQKELISLEALGTKVKDVSGLASLPKLESLDISDTPVADATVLGTCPTLNTLYCSENTSTAGLPDRIDVVVY